MSSEISHKLASQIKTTLKVLFAVAVIVWLVKTGRLDFSALGTLLKPQVFLTLALLTGANLFLAMERWRFILKSQNLPHTRSVTWRLSIIGVFFNFVVPGGVGGDVIKAFYVAKGNPLAKTKAVVTVAMDRLLGLYTMLAMAISVMILNFNEVHAHKELTLILTALISIASLFSIFWIIIFSKRLSSLQFLKTIISKLPHSQRFLKTFVSFSEYAENKNLLFKAMGISLVAQVFSILVFYMAGYYLGFVEIPISLYFFVVPIGFMVTAIPISPAGVGIGQAAFYYLFNLASGKTTTVGSATVTSSQILMLFYAVLGAWYYINLKKTNTSSLSATNPEGLG
jgi:glycosyltransferase 2 family protein